MEGTRQDEAGRLAGIILLGISAGFSLVSVPLVANAQVLLQIEILAGDKCLKSTNESGLAQTLNERICVTTTDVLSAKMQL